MKVCICKNLGNQANAIKSGCFLSKHIKVIVAPLGLLCLL